MSYDYIKLEEDGSGISDESDDTPYLGVRKGTKGGINYKPYGSDYFINQFSSTDALFYWNII